MGVDFQSEFDRGEMGVEPAVDPKTHAFIPTLGGRCARIGCQRPQIEHPVFLAVEEAGCRFDHTFQKNWMPCPGCGVFVEPKCVTGNGPQGTPFGVGRGDVTVRFAKKLWFIQWLQEKLR